MREEYYETKEHVITEQVLVRSAIICDVCKKEIQSDAGYWEVTTHHNDWGNDSIDSYEAFDICSVECLKSKFDEYCDNSNSQYNTWQIEVEHTRRS